MTAFNPPADISRLFGVRVRLPDRCPRCGDELAVIARSTVQDGLELSCLSCSCQRDYLHREITSWLTAVTKAFGTPDVPVVLRHGRSPPSTTVVIHRLWLDSCASKPGSNSSEHSK
jgi:hypothetical protein